MAEVDDETGKFKKEEDTFEVTSEHTEQNHAVLLLRSLLGADSAKFSQQGRRDGLQLAVC